jgi:DNA polymerase elongation subunit (family B)
MTGPKILTLDIETRPAQVYVWDIFKPFVSIDQVIEPGGLLSFAAKWHGEKKVHFYSDWEHGHEAMVRAAWELLNEADIVVTYNGDNFDILHLNREFSLLELGPHAPFRSVDLYKVVKKQERHLSHKLAWVTQVKMLSGKVDPGGFKTWLGVLADDPKAQAQMKRYNIQDVRTTEELFDNMLPFIKMPHVALYGEEMDGGLTCPLGHTRFQKRGYRLTNTRRYQRYQCQDCGRFFSDNRSSGSVSTS